MRRIAVILVTGLALLSAAPAGAHHGHTSCAAFGAGAAAQAHEFGGVGSFVKTINTGPGAVSGVVASFHEEFCAPAGD